MHEVSLMQNMLRIVEDAAESQGDGTVTSIHMRIGVMAGVNIDSLRFAFDILSKGTRAEGGELVIDRVPFRIRCRNCGSDLELSEMTLRCPSCRATDIEVVSGREMEVDHIIMDDGNGAGEEAG